jgi:hypothetical protein
MPLAALPEAKPLKSLINMLFWLEDAGIASHDKPICPDF